MLHDLGIIKREWWKGDGNVAKTLEINLQPKKQKKVTAVRWLKLSFGHFKLNTDGSSLGNPGPHRVGVVIRNHNGQVIAAHGAGIGITTNNYAELSTLVFGIKMVRDLGLDSIWAELDVKVIIDIVKRGSAGEWRLQELLQQYKTITESIQVHITHVYREGNMVANYLAKHGAKHQTTWDFPGLELLPCLKGILRTDK